MLLFSFNTRFNVFFIEYGKIKSTVGTLIFTSCHHIIELVVSVISITTTYQESPILRRTMVQSVSLLMMLLSGSRWCSSSPRTGGEAFRGGSEASGRGEDPGAEQHGGAGTKDQRAGQPNGRICPRGKEKTKRRQREDKERDDSVLDRQTQPQKCCRFNNSLFNVNLEVLFLKRSEEFYLFSVQ